MEAGGSWTSLSVGPAITTTACFFPTAGPGNPAAASSVFFVPELSAGFAAVLIATAAFGCAELSETGAGFAAALIAVAAFGDAGASEGGAGLLGADAFRTRVFVTEADFADGAERTVEPPMIEGCKGALAGVEAASPLVAVFEAVLLAADVAALFVAGPSPVVLLFTVVV